MYILEYEENMNTINAINILDGNQYQVQNDTSSEQVSSDFDAIYQSQSEEMTLDDIFKEVSEEYGVNESLLKAVAQAESGFDTNAQSPCGAMGIMQLMPTTAESLGVEDPYDARQSITGGAKMLAYLLDDYNGNVTLALAAYNAGSGSVSKYGGVPPYKETVNYINKINGILGGALEGDSTTIAGSAATNLDGVSKEQAPNNPVKGNQNGANPSKGNASFGLNSSFAQILNNRSELAVNNGLMSYEDYEYFLNTYKKIFEKLSENLATDGVSGETSDGTGDSQIDISDLATQVNSETKQNEEKESSASSIVGGSSDSMLKYNASVASSAMLNSLSYDGIVKNNPQSLYEAQASVISPFVSQLYNS